MRSVNRRSFLASSAGVAGAVGVGAAISATTGSGMANAQGLPLGSSGMVPIDNPGLVGVEAPAGSLEAAGQVRFQLPDGLTDWINLPAPDGARDDQVGTRATGGLPTPDGATAFEVRATDGHIPLFAGSSEQPTGSSAVDEFVRSQGQLDTQTLRNYNGLATVDMLGVPVVPRWAWGADEGITWWEPYYRDAQVLTVHHSVTPAGWDTAATMRSFHRYHTVSNGWGDIGYQLVIDPAGVVYQGRRSNMPVFEAPPVPGFRPRSTVGAHVGGNNSGNIGVCLMGDFTGSMPTPAAWSSLVNVLARLSMVLNIDPLGGVQYFNPDAGVGSQRWSINGHRDWMQTGCPGNMLHGALGALRGQVAAHRATLGLWPGSAGLPGSSSSTGSLPAPPPPPQLGS